MKRLRTLTGQYFIWTLKMCLDCNEKANFFYTFLNTFIGSGDSDKFCRGQGVVVGFSGGQVPCPKFFPRFIIFVRFSHLLSLYQITVSREGRVSVGSLSIIDLKFCLLSVCVKYECICPLSSCILQKHADIRFLKYKNTLLKNTTYLKSWSTFLQNTTAQRANTLILDSDPQCTFLVTL